MTIAITFQNVDMLALQKYKHSIKIPQTYKLLSVWNAYVFTLPVVLSLLIVLVAATFY